MSFWLGLIITEKTLNHEKTLYEPVLKPKNMDNNSGKKPSVACDECGHSTKTKTGLKLHTKNKHCVPQFDGSEFICEEKEIETQTDLFLSIDIEGEIIGTELDNIYYKAPSSVYHPIKGMGKSDTRNQREVLLV